MLSVLLIVIFESVAAETSTSALGLSNCTSSADLENYTFWFLFTVNLSIGPFLVAFA
jgi:hypothetical protein